MNLLNIFYNLNRKFYNLYYYQTHKQMTSILLQSLKNGQLKNSGIIDHLSHLIRQQISNKTELKGMSNLQVFSYYLRTNQFNFKQYIEGNQLNQIMSQPKQQIQYVKNVNKLNTKVNQLQNRKAYFRPNLLQEYYALKQCGISLGQTNYVHLNNVLKTIASQNACTQVKFWGKILGHRDYYVIQGPSSKKYLNQLGPDSQNYGTGINSYSYWVSNSILGNWTQLPLVTPLQVKQSRDFKYIFSGDLQKNINTFGKLIGKQKHLLKCTIARITHSCQIVPKGIYKLNQQNPSIVEFQQELKIPQVSQMNSLQSWVHFNPHILNQGRASYYIDPKLSQEQKQALNAQLGQSDPIVERFKGIAEDKPFEALGYASNWTVQLCGQTVPISLVGKQQGQSSVYASVLLKNLVWPGAYTVGFKGGWTNLYVGYGHRISQQNNLIKQLSNLQIEGQSKKQFGQPNPSKPPVVQSKPPGEQNVNIQNAQS